MSKESKVYSLAVKLTVQAVIEEAAAQGLIAGINAFNYINGSEMLESFPEVHPTQEL